MIGIDALGYLAGFFLIMMACMKSQIHMRACNIAGNATFILYGFLAEVWPVFVLNAVMLLLHGYRLMCLRKAAS
jgi:hypothetical protein